MLLEELVPLHEHERQEAHSVLLRDVDLAYFRERGKAGSEENGCDQ
jgi:hypothetical protein